MQAQNVPADAVTALVVNLTEEEREYLLAKVRGSMAVARSNMTDTGITQLDRDYYAGQYALAVRLLTKLGA